MTPRVLVTGAGGKTGRAVVRALRDDDVPVVALVRDPVRHADLGAHDAGVVLATGDQRSVDDLATALSDCTAVYAIAPNMTTDELDMGAAIIAACRRAGVRRLGYHSVMDPFQPAMPHHADKGRVEGLVRASGLDWTILRPNAYLQNLDGYAAELRSGSYRVPYASERPLAMVDLHEVAEVAAGSLAGRLARSSEAVWDLAGPRAVSPADVAATATELLGRTVVAEREDPDDWLDCHPELPEEVAPRFRLMFDFYDRHGFPGDPAALRTLLGREPRDLRDHLAALLGTADVTSGRATGP